MDSYKKNGYLMAFSAYVIWGILAIYWKQIHHLNPVEILTVRIVNSAICLWILVHVLGNKVYRSYLKEPKICRGLMLSSIVIALNWGFYVYAVAIGEVVQASLGYFINPLVSILFGVIFMKEKLNTKQYVAIAFATCGVLYMTLSYGRPPWIALVLAFSFAAYGLLKKKFHLDSLNSLLVEVLYLSPVMLGLSFIAFRSNGTQIAGTTVTEMIFLLLAGIVTVIPLVLFSEGAKRIPLSSIGFLQYVAPTMMLFIGVVMYGEPFTINHTISFGFIWTGLAIYTTTLIKKRSPKTEKVL